MTLVTVRVLVTVMKNQQVSGPQPPEPPVNPEDLADLVDLVVSNKPYLYIELEHQQIMVMRRPLTALLSLSNRQIMVM